MHLQTFHTYRQHQISTRISTRIDDSDPIEEYLGMLLTTGDQLDLQQRRMAQSLSLLASVLAAGISKWNLISAVASAITTHPPTTS